MKKKIGDGTNQMRKMGMDSVVADVGVGGGTGSRGERREGGAEEDVFAVGEFVEGVSGVGACFGWGEFGG